MARCMTVYMLRQGGDRIEEALHREDERDHYTKLDTAGRDRIAAGKHDHRLRDNRSEDRSSAA